MSLKKHLLNWAASWVSAFLMILLGVVGIPVYFGGGLASQVGAVALSFIVFLSLLYLLLAALAVSWAIVAPAKFLEALAERRN